jgi:light-regulated signal transduction histidine kinase (bacteriophytochrome)
MWTTSRINFTDEEVPVSASLQDSNITIRFDGSNIRHDVCICTNSVLNLADELRKAVGEPTYQELEDKILSLEANNEELSNLIEQQEEYDQAVKEKLGEGNYPF